MKEEKGIEAKEVNEKKRGIKAEKRVHVGRRERSVEQNRIGK